MKEQLIRQLLDEAIIDENTAGNIRRQEENREFSIHWQLKILLYLGISLIAAGLGLLIYDNIDSIGHVTIVIVIAIICLGCFAYCARSLRPFSFGKVESQGLWYDYILLLGCLTFLILEGYLQWQYNIFGDRYGLATIIPTIVLLIVAYRFNHQGVLTMSITLFASWVGISLAPMDFFTKNNFEGEQFIYSAIFLGVLYGVLAYGHHRFDFKKHYTFVYANFAVHLACIASLYALIVFDYWALWLLLFVGCVFAVAIYARSIHSYYLAVCAVLYAYIGISYLTVRGLVYASTDVLSVYLILFYFIISAIGTIVLLKRLRKII